MMNYIKFTDFRNHSKDYFDKVESGNSYIIIRKGKPIAQVLPFNSNSQSWKRPIKPIKLRKKILTTDILMEERAEKK